MQRTLKAIRDALGATSATLLLTSAGCAMSEPAPDDDGSGSVPHPTDAAVVVQMPFDARAPEADASVKRDAAVVLATFPLEALACRGTDYSDPDGGPLRFGYHGQCCDRAMCYPAEPGESCLDAMQAQSTHFFFGSGTCNCGEVRGPYARPADGASVTPGECCYAVPVIGCDGRPLTTDRGHLLAPLVSGTAWIA